MKITTVTYQKSYVIGPFLQEKIGFEAEINEFDHGKDTGEILDHLRTLADDWHKKTNPHLYHSIDSGPNIQATPNAPTSLSPYEINIQHERIQIAIENAKTPDELKQVKADHPLMPARLMEYYNTKMAQLNGKQ